MLSFLKSRTFLIFVGFVLLALVIWFAGPYFAFADYYPLESVIARLVFIGLVVAVWAVSVLIKRLRANRASDQLVQAVVKQEEKERPSAEAAQLRERFEEAVAVLKAKRRGGHSLYELPWYVIIGAPGSGKTTALVNSGLNFPLEQRSGKGALRGVGGTRNCDWWFTDEAVMLDTAGRYTTQDSDASADSAAWSEFLALLRKYRKRRPVNGVILTISVPDLILQGQAGREAHVAAARRRLLELNKELRIQLPVYLMVTKCDLIAGFNEYFDDLPAEGRSQVWGVTFPYDQTVKGEGPKIFPSEFDALVERLNAHVFDRIESERDVQRRTKIFGFPQQTAALRDALSDFVTEVFAGTRFDQPILLRGVYLTSGTQEGTPIDRLLGAIGRRFSVAPDAVVAPRGRGKAFFIERLLKEVMFGESGLAGVNRRFEVQKAAAQLGAYAVMIAIAVIGVIAFSISYSRNRSYVDAVAGDVAKLKSVPSVTQAASLEETVPRLDAVRAVYESANRYTNDTPWGMRWGLYQGNAIGNGARDAYSRELGGALLSRIAARFAERMNQFAPEPEKLYEYLKAYLMLGQPEHLDKNHLRFLADLEWEAIGSVNPDAAAGLKKHFNSLLEDDSALRPVSLNDALVVQARSTIQQASIPRLIYSQVRLNYSGDSAGALRLDLLSGVGSDQVLRRKSGRSLADPVPSLYTKKVFQEVTGRDADALVKQFSADSWVWGQSRPSITGTAKLKADTIDVYEKDYIAAWDAILNDLDIVGFSGPKAAEMLAILGGATSPLRGFLKVVDDNTYLTPPPEPPKPGAAGVAGLVPGGLTSLIQKGKQLGALAGMPTAVPGGQITAHFEAVHRMVSGTPGGAPPQIDSILQKFNQLQQKIAPISQTAIGGTSPADPGTIAAVGQIAGALKVEAAALPPPVAAVVNQVGSSALAVSTSGLRDVLEDRYRQEVQAPCIELVQGRYPFVTTSAVDVPLADFGRVFAPGGVFDMFFKSSLEQYVDTTRNPWAWRADASGTAAGRSPAMLRQFQLAQRIRDTFFPTAASQLPSMRLRMTTSSLDSNALRFVLEVDGQNAVNYRHGPEANPETLWPGPTPGAAAATFEDKTGTRPNVVAQGPWAIFRLFDAGQFQRETDSVYMFTVSRGGHEARVRIDAQTIRNPLGKRDVQQFTCGI
jgi:type VI secretion system protein ImpL